jgi:2'-5' RNA ligase
MRCFFAVEFDDPTKKCLAELQHRLSAMGIKGNYSRPENFHLTLKFLGEVQVDLIPRLTGLMKNVASEHEAFVLSFDQLGKFNKGNRSIIWMGIQNNRELSRLQKSLDLQLLDFFSGNLERSAFSPHITMIREAVIPKVQQDQSPEEAFTSIKRELGTVNLVYAVKGISLMESTRINDKLTYLQKSYADLGAC